MSCPTSLDPKVLDIPAFTGGEQKGSGIFEELMRAVKSHLAEEHKAGRITGDQYTKAYIASLESAMAQGSNYLLQHQLINQQIRLLDQEILSAEKNVELVQKQIDKMDAEINLITEQVETENKRQLTMDQELINLGKQEDMLDGQIIGIDKDNLLKDEQVLQIRAQTSLTNQQESNLASEQANITKQGIKLDTETAVLEQKRITEEAQTKDTVGGEPITGVIGHQKTLYTNQAEGYIRDAEQKAAKIFMDSFNTRTSIETLNENETIDATVTGTQIKEVLNKVREGVGVTPQS